MKQLKDISIKIKLPLMIGGASFIVLAIVCFALMRPLRSAALNSSSKIAQLTAIGAGQRLAEVINSAGSVARAYSGVIEQTAADDVIPADQKRNLLLMGMEQLVLKEDKLRNIWCLIEPNALDGLDSLYINQTGSNSNGNFVPWFILENGAVRMDISEESYNASYYQQVKSTMREMITEPYTDKSGKKNILIFSICIPLIVDGNFIGVIGTDFEVERMIGIVSSLDNNNTTVGKLLSNKGTVVVYRDITRVGQIAEHNNRDILDLLPLGKMFEGMYTFEGRVVYKVYVPIQLGEGNLPWFYAVDLPREDVYASSSLVVRYLILFNLVGIFLIGLVGWLLAQALLAGVAGVTGIIHKLSFGRIDLDINTNLGEDELGQINKELGSLVEGLQRTASFAKDIGEGNLDATFEPLSTEDILGNSLLEMRDNLKSAQEERIYHQKTEEQRNWVTTGVAKFAEILRQDNDNLEVLSYNIISNLVKYLGVNQGGIFILNEEGAAPFLEMKACYAFDRKKFAEKHIQPGEGLIGACYLEGEPIYLTDLPHNYIEITSGLGGDNPKALLINPMKINSEIYGIIEIASFELLEPYQREFVERVSESIAATISMVKINMHTNQLLMQTKLQAEEMANQEEELRQNMEEMQATQEEMRRRETDLTNALTKMEQIQKNMK